MHIQCANCGHRVKYYQGQGGITADGTIALNIPGIVCGGHCIDDLIDYIIGEMMCVTELSPQLAASAMLDMRFDAGSETAADFFLQLFPTNGEIIDNAAVRLYQEGNREKAYSILDYGLKHGDDTNRLRLELAAFIGKASVSS